MTLVARLHHKSFLSDDELVAPHRGWFKRVWEWFFEPPKPEARWVGELTLFAKAGWSFNIGVEFLPWESPDTVPQGMPGLSVYRFHVRLSGPAPERFKELFDGEHYCASHRVSRRARKTELSAVCTYFIHVIQRKLLRVRLT